MGNSGSSHQPGPSGGPVHAHHQHYHQHQQGMTRGWTQSFPRELSRHQHTQPTGHKVLPEPPNQRLRATNNGSIIHNGGTISGRRPGALTLPHDLNKQGVFRSRSTSASNFGAPRTSRREDHRCCQYTNEPHSMEQEMQELKRFGSEPDLRYSPLQRNERPPEPRQVNGHYPERESRYKNRKKYKAPPPPTNTDGSSPDSYKWEEVRCRPEEDAQPPPRRSRLFKTRAETKRAQVNWTSSSGQERNEECAENERRWRTEREMENLGRGSHGWQDQDHHWSRDPHRRSKVFDGKNTLQRSMSSPEFQAELMQVARKVRNKLSCGTDSPKDIAEKRCLARTQEVSFEERRLITREERRLVVEKKGVSYREEYSKDNEGRRRKDLDDNRRRLPEKSTSDTMKATSRETPRKPLKEKPDVLPYCQPGHDPAGNRKFDDYQTRTRSESPVRISARDKMDLRGQGSGRESTPEPNEQKIRDKENSDPRWRRDETRTNDLKSEKRWSEPNTLPDKKDFKPKDKSTKKDVREAHDNWHILPEPEKSTPKTFYFGMEEELQKELQNPVEQHTEQVQSRLAVREIDGSQENQSDTEDNKNGIEDISLKLRPTLPKKQLEIPRFSPSAAWRLLSALEAPGPTMSTASEEIPVMFEERIERLSRPPPPLVGLIVSPRSSHDKSGDSGISGDAGAPNDDSLDVSTTNRLKTSATRPTWTPQQDLGEESSSDAGVDSPPPMPMPVKFPPRAHVFSLSLPREDNRMYVYNPEAKGKDNSAFNSLQKLKRSVSGAFGLPSVDLDRKRTNGEILDDNWLLSTSAPTSLQHNQLPEINGSTPSTWKPNFRTGNEEEDEEDVDEFDDRIDFPVIMKPPSFSYLASGGHVMYLPESNGSSYQPQSLTGKSSNSVENEKNLNNSMPKYRKNGTDDPKKSSRVYSSSINDVVKGNKQPKNLASFRERSFVDESGLKSQQFSGYSKSCENITEMKQRNGSPSRQNLQDTKETSSEIKAPAKNNSKSRRFTFQSTVRQIERRRLAEKLSREAEAKERQRKGELEAMRKVEEDFQRKRAREKASIRQQLRLYSMDENLSSLPTGWDSSQVSRADPDGAPSSSASSPTSAPPGKLLANRKNSVSSDEYHKKRTPSSDSRKQQQQQREYKDYRPKYYDWAPETSSHIDYKQTTVHPKVVCDIPKSSPVFVDANVHGNKTANQSPTPRSDNYRKDFAHGAVAGKSSLASSDSELSQPNTRPHSRQAGNNKTKPLRSRSASPDRSMEAASSEDENPVEPVKQERNTAGGFPLNGVQPFVREKSYRPISFNPQPPPPPIPS